MYIHIVNVHMYTCIYVRIRTQHSFLVRSFLERRAPHISPAPELHITRCRRCRPDHPNGAYKLSLGLGACCAARKIDLGSTFFIFSQRLHKKFIFAKISVANQAPKVSYSGPARKTMPEAAAAGRTSSPESVHRTLAGRCQRFIWPRKKCR